MTRLINAIILLLLFATPLVAQQKFSVAPRVGYGSFKMEGMKNLQQEVISDSDIHFKATDEFPAHYLYGIEVAYRINKLITTGLVLETGSTGGRIAYSDYSGSAHLDQLLKYNAVGLFAEHEIAKGNFLYSMGLETSLINSSLKIESMIEVRGDSDSESLSLESRGMGFKPYVGFGYQIKRFVPRISAGWQIFSGAPFHLEGQSEMILRVDGVETGPEWEGYRLNLSLGILIF